MVNRLLWSMLTVKGCGMMWTLEYLEQDKVLYLRCDKALSSGKTRRYFSSKHELMEVLTLEEALDETSRNWADARTGKDQNSMCVVMELVQKVDFRVTLVTPPVKSAGPKPGPRRREGSPLYHVTYCGSATGFCSLVVAVGNLGGGIKDVFLEVSAIVQPVLYGMSRSVYRKECLAECLVSCAGREIRRAISTFNMKRSPSQVAWFSLSTQKFLPEEVRSWEDGDPLLWSMLTEKGCGMMWTLKHLKQDKVLFMEDECSIQAAVSVIEFNYRGKQVDIFSQNMDYGSLTLEEAFDETSRNLADARTG
ncbi:hypothetical protein KY285_030130 [Solanum tuberosum]|nr:hypothetical protein KY285_030130 [Solanum tuberosum]